MNVGGKIFKKSAIGGPTTTRCQRVVLDLLKFKKLLELRGNGLSFKQITS